MTWTVAIDPGLRACGVAIGCAGSLTWAGLVLNPIAPKTGAVPRGPDTWQAVSEAILARCSRIDRLVVEWMQIYPHQRAPIDREDLAQLQGVAATVQASARARHPGCRVKAPHPRMWKGQLPKDVCKTRVESRLTPEEGSAVELPAASLAHNVWDAVGLYLWAEGRFSGDPPRW